MGGGGQDGVECAKNGLSSLNFTYSSTGQMAREYAKRRETAAFIVYTSMEEGPLAAGRLSHTASRRRARTARRARSVMCV